MLIGGLVEDIGNAGFERGCSLNNHGCSQVPPNRIMEEKKEQLESVLRKKALLRLVEGLSATQTDLYYQSTSEIARILKQVIKQGDGISQAERELLSPLSERDIQLILSLHS